MTSATLFGVWATAGPLVHAVGEAGTILTLEDGTWRLETVTAYDLFAVHGGGAGVFAVGERGTILRKHESGWRASESGTTVNLRGVWVGDTTAHVVGDEGTFLEILSGM